VVLMQRVLVFREETLVGPPEPGVPDMLVALDPETGEAEVVLDRALFSVEPGGPLDIELPLPEPRAPPPPDKPFRAVVKPERLSGLEARAALMPGARDASLRACGIAPRTARTGHLLTELPVKVGTTEAQALELAPDMLAADELSVELRVLALTGGGAVTIELQTAMQNESTVGWVSAGRFTAVGTAPSIQVMRFTHLLRYVRWSVSSLTGSSPSATFLLAAFAKTWSRDLADRSAAVEAPSWFLTECPVVVTTTGAQALELAREVLSADELSVELRVLVLSGGGALTIELQTGMHKDSPLGWVSAGQFTAVSSAPAIQVVRFTHLLRYVRWNVTALTGSSPSAAFLVSAVERTWSKAEAPPRREPRPA
jgi:hypothetical protein